MSSGCVPLVLLLALRAAIAAPATGWVSAPLSWSTDSRWLSYVTVSDLESRGLPPSWLLGTAIIPAQRAASPAADQKAPARPLVYRIWATAPAEGMSALIEESRWPLTAPSWSPLGKSIAFCRFVANSGDPNLTGQRGQFEVVVQTALDVKKVVWSFPDLELDQETRALLPQLSCSWSSDQSWLAIPVPGPRQVVVIVDVKAKKRACSISGAVLPVWSADGSKCAYVRRDGSSNTVEFVERRGTGFSEPQPVVIPATLRAAPCWGADGRSIVAVVQVPNSRFLDVELVRFPLDNRAPVRLLSLIPDGRRRLTKLRSVTIDFQRETERCVYSLDVDAPDFDVVSWTPQEQEIHPGFHPLDASLRIGGLAISPDAKSVAVRFGTPDDLSPPAVFDADSERTSLLVPDETCRREWLARLVGAAERLLARMLPPASVDGQAARRPTLLPLPGELASLGTVIARLDRIAGHGSSLVPATIGKQDSQEQPAQDVADLEASLFFDYLRGRFREAESELSALERQLASPAERLALLALRAQILLAEGHRDRARSVIEYLLATEGTSTERIEVTPLGPVATKEVSPAQAWARYLSTHAAKEPQTTASLHQGRWNGVPDPPMPRDPFANINDGPP
jgi:hypothetical protein